MASSAPEESNGVATVTPVPTVPSADDVTIDITNAPPSPASAAEGDHPRHQPQLLDQAPSDQQPGAVVEQLCAVVEMPTCERQMINLVEMQITRGEAGPDVRKKLVAQEALQEWKEAQSGLQGKVERRTKQTDKLIFEIYQLVGLYSVFVGVVFTATVQSARLQCKHIWSPVVLCAVAWLIIIHVTRKRWKRYKALRATIKSEETSRRAIYGQISRLKLFGHNDFDFKQDAVENIPDEPENQSTNSGLRVPASWVIPFVLTALTCVLVGSFIHILCFP